MALCCARTAHFIALMALFVLIIGQMGAASLCDISLTVIMPRVAGHLTFCHN